MSAPGARINARDGELISPKNPLPAAHLTTIHMKGQTHGQG